VVQIWQKKKDLPVRKYTHRLKNKREALKRKRYYLTNNRIKNNEIQNNNINNYKIKLTILFLISIISYLSLQFNALIIDIIKAYLTFISSSLFTFSLVILYLDD
jgi:hypothetical protein